MGYPGPAVERLRTLVVLLALVSPSGSCFLVDEEDCGADYAACSGDFIEECSGGHGSTTDCRAVCGGTCGYDEGGAPTCLCP